MAFLYYCPRCGDFVNCVPSNLDGKLYRLCTSYHRGPPQLVHLCKECAAKFEQIVESFLNEPRGSGTKQL